MKGWKTLQLTLRDETIKELLALQEKANKDVGRLLKDSERINRTKPLKVTANVRKYENIRNYAKDLYDVLRHSFTCGCAFPHNANLYIERRISAHTTFAYQSQELHLKVLLSFTQAQTNQSGAPPWGWRETRIEALKYPDIQAHVAGKDSQSLTNLLTDIQIAAAHTSTSVAIPRNLSYAERDLQDVENSGDADRALLQTGVRNVTLLRPAKSKRVSFALSDQVTTDTGSSADPQQARGRPLAGLQNIEDLCRVMFDAKVRSCVGVLADQEGKRHRVSLVNVSKGNDLLQTVSLQDLKRKKG